MDKKITKINKAILIIEDEEETGRLLGRFLSRYFEIVFTEQNLKSGMLSILNSSPDVLILDNNLPDGNGVENIQNFLSAAPEMKIIVISAMNYLGKEAIQKGATDFVEKPIALPHLLHSVMDAVES